ncbi:MAG: hypothetical protein ACFFAH_06180 [Promethearchaeota archaeon]
MTQLEVKNILLFPFNEARVDHFKEYTLAKNLKHLNEKDKKIALDILIKEFELK